MRIPILELGSMSLSRKSGQTFAGFKVELISGIMGIFAQEGTGIDDTEATKIYGGI